MDIIAEIAKFGIKPGASIKFEYAMGESCEEFSGEILRIVDCNNIRVKPSISAKMSLYRCTVKLENDVRDFWEADMIGIELI